MVYEGLHRLVLEDWYHSGVILDRSRSVNGRMSISSELADGHGFTYDEFFGAYSDFPKVPFYFNLAAQNLGEESSRRFRHQVLVRLLRELVAREPAIDADLLVGFPQVSRVTTELNEALVGEDGWDVSVMPLLKEGRGGQETQLTISEEFRPPIAIEGERVLVICGEVSRYGGNLERTVTMLRGFGYEVQDVIALVDSRRHGVRMPRGLQLRSLFRAYKLFAYCRERGYIRRDDFEAIARYLTTRPTT